MKPAILKIYSENEYDLEKFLSLFYEKEIILENKSYYEIKYDNPITMIDILTTFIENEDSFNLSLWISLDIDIYILVNTQNLDQIIKYLYERYPNN